VGIVTATLCPFGDPFCPCQDGAMACHYVGLPGSPGMAPPTDGERAAWARALADLELHRQPAKSNYLE
jgi:hypothetical protein